MLNFITHKDDAKKAVEEFEATKNAYEKTVKSIQHHALMLFEKREKVLDESVNLFNRLVLINGIPSHIINQIETQLTKQQIKRLGVTSDHSVNYEMPNEENSQAWKYMFGAAGVGSGAAVAGGSILTALATTFGTASTGAAISSLSGVAATNAVLAWIGGGTIAAGGGGMALGSTILGLMGPVGWGIAGLSIVGGGWSLRNKNDKIIAEYQKATKEYHHHEALLSSKIAEVKGLEDDTDENLKILKHYSNCKYPSDFNHFTDDDKFELGQMVRDILSSLRHLNKAVV